MDQTETFNAAVREGFARWAKMRGCRRKKLTANCPAEVGIRVTALEKSNFEPAYYLRYGIWLGGAPGIVDEPDCDIRLTVDGPWGAQPALRLNAAPEPEDIVALLEQYVDPLLAQTDTRAALEKLRAEGGLRQAAILREARAVLGWQKADGGGT